MRKLAMRNRAALLDDLRIPPANRPETLKGSRTGRRSVRINGRFRLCLLARRRRLRRGDRRLPLRPPPCAPFPTPGEILLEEFLKPMAISQYRLARNHVHKGSRVRANWAPLTGDTWRLQRLHWYTSRCAKWQ